jgi:hypothetical protein
MNGKTKVQIVWLHMCNVQIYLKELSNENRGELKWYHSIRPIYYCLVNKFIFRNLNCGEECVGSLPGRQQPLKGRARLEATDRDLSPLPTSIYCKVPSTY